MLCSIFGVVTLLAVAPGIFAADIVKDVEGQVDGMGRQKSGVRIFLGIPFAKAPVGNLRWAPPQPVDPWKGVKTAQTFGARCMQAELTTDIVTRAPQMSEDCLNLNVWTPAKAAAAKLPVLVYIYGGGFIAGDASESRYDGEALAKKGIVVVTLNYRLGLFGFMAHPELSKESRQSVSGNYGLFDQVAALEWVRRNIAAFGGDPKHVTIAGESAGSMSVSAQVVSPLAKGLFTGAIGESGSVVTGVFAIFSPLHEAESSGIEFERKAGVDSLAALRAQPATALESLYERATASGPFDRSARVRFSPNVDGYFFPKRPGEILAAGEQNRVPTMAGSNSEESGYNALLGEQTPTIENYKKVLLEHFGERADQAFRLYPATTDGEAVKDAAQTLSTDMWVGYCTWKWLTVAAKTGNQPAYYYFYAHPRPQLRPEALEYFRSWWTYSWNDKTYPRPMPRGAVHSAEIEYALGNLDGNKVYAWTPQDETVSKIMQSYFVNFVKTGNPNGAGLPEWPAYGNGQRMRIDAASHAEPDIAKARFEFLEETIFHQR
jgi:para-nitrobenzyl esterase